MENLHLNHYISIEDRIYTKFETIWREYPALLYGIAVALGSAAGLGFVTTALSVWLLLFFPLFFQPIFSSKSLTIRLMYAFIIFLFVSLWTSNQHIFPHIPAAGVHGEGIFQAASIHKQSHHFGNRWIYKGNLFHYLTNNHQEPLKLKNIPITIQLPDKEGLARPSANSSYLIKGILKKTKNGKLYLQTPHINPWIPIPGKWSLAEFRFKVKQALINYIKQKYPHANSQTFLSGIATGEFDDKQMSLDFGRFGLQHIMAISGFHFSLLAGFLSLILRIFLPKKIAFSFLTLFLTSYFIFLGPTASVMRAWIMCVIASIGVILEKKTCALNSLGIAMIIVLIYDPLQILELGFQFSFAITATILIFYPLAEDFLQKFFLKRTLTEALNFHPIDKHAYILLSVIRQGIALSIAVNLIAIPVTLYYFQKFPVLSLLFNLFFPFFLSLSILLLLIGFMINPLPYVGDLISRFNDIYTQLILNLTTYTPKKFDIYIEFTEMSSWMLVFYLCCTLTVGIILKNHQESKQRQTADWMFV